MEVNTESSEEHSELSHGVDGRQGRWSQEEHELFLRAIDQFGREWDKVQTVVKTRSLAQIRSHAQKYFQKINRAEAFDRIYEQGSCTADSMEAQSVLQFMNNVLERMKSRRGELQMNSSTDESSQSDVAASTNRPSDESNGC
jgi:SHAQKYF class myb-like DNA-binding protein